MKRVMATSRLAGILRLKDQEAEELLADHCLFGAKKMDDLRSRPVEREERIYQLEGLICTISDWNPLSGRTVFSA